MHVVGRGGWRPKKHMQKPQAAAGERSSFARGFAQRSSAASCLDKLW